MTTEEIKIVKQTWRNLEGIDPTLFGDVFYSRLFIADPSLKKMFRLPQEVQSKKLIDTLDLIVKSLGRLDELGNQIKDLGEKHVKYGVLPHHYDKVGDALIWSLKKGLGKDWNIEVENAWKKCYTILVNAMTN
ncbi:MAG: hemoglobin [Cytophagaceae bacterium]|nr:hemoglobin [Cytophagaceae bacterium]MBL0304185.1 hemoglobin [Cytophagaceae bacterium]MBL0326995.1 hemoglobin [Cytophagaceae bacterium]